MNLYYLAAALGCLAAGLILWAAVRLARHPEAAPETQDDFTTSVARWGHLHDKRQG